MAAKKESLSAEDKEFLFEIFKQAEGTIYGVDYQTFILKVTNALNILTHLGKYVHRDHTHDTLDLNLTGLMALPMDEVQEFLMICDDIYFALLESVKRQQFSLHTSVISNLVNRQQPIVARCLLAMSTHPGITICETIGIDSEVGLNAELMRYGSFREYAGESVATWGTSDTLSTLDTMAETGYQRPKEFEANNDNKRILYAAALYLSQQDPQRFRDNTGKLNHTLLASVIFERFQEFWPNEEESPLDENTIRRDLSDVLTGHYLKQ